MWAWLRSGVIAASALALLPACASTATQSASLDPKSRPIPDALPIGQNDITTQVVIAESTEGVGATWTSVTDSQLGRTATELSNLGGAPIVLGAVGAIVAMDAKPRGRAARTATGAAGTFLPEDLDSGFADELDAALADDEQSGADIRIQRVKRVRDLPEDAWLVFTDYTLAEDGTALRATAQVAHTDDVRPMMEAQAEAKRRRMSSTPQPGYVTRTFANRYESGERDKLRRRKVRKPRYKGTFVFHSDSFVLPDAGDIQADDRRADIERRLVAALDAERDARRAAADAEYAAAMEAAGDKASRIRKAESRRAKAYAKADSLHAKSLETARDGEIDKMERLVLGIARWTEEADDGETTVLGEAIDSAHQFFAEALAQRLPHIGTGEPVIDRELTHEETVRGVVVLGLDADGRSVIEVLEGPQAGTVISVPEDGAAEYGTQTADP